MTPTEYLATVSSSSLNIDMHKKISQNYEYSKITKVLRKEDLKC